MAFKADEKHFEEKIERTKLDSSSDEVSNNVNAKLANPLAGKSDEELIAEAEAFAREHDLLDAVEELRTGAILARDPTAFDTMSFISPELKEELRKEFTHKWRHTKTLYALVACCSMGAVVQGQDQSLINAANIFFPRQFGIGTNSERDTWLLGLVNAAPYFGCAFFACWLTDPLNRYFGRKGTILISLVFATFPCLWAACTTSWQNMLAARFVLSLGIGPKSSTVPIYAAESAPPAIRGALVMMWQMWTAFGIMIGYVCGLMFYHVKDTNGIEGLNWRLMLGSGIVPPLIVMAQVVFCPESPRWLMEKGKHRKAFEALCKLRMTKVQAARDLFYINTLLRIESKLHTGNRYVELVSKPRNRRATQAAFIVMFMQQFCGVNVIAYYSSRILVEAGGFGDLEALIGSFGFGLINFLFALPAVWTIDTFGRRNLLLTTFPLMSLWLIMTGAAFYIPEGDGRLATILLGIYLFAMCYSPGEGPVPFTYSAEAFPLYIRPIGMSFATATCWLFNGVLAITWPSMQEAMTASGDLVGFLLVLLFVPETKALSLEELDQVFSVPTRKHAAYGLRQISYFFKKRILRRKDVVREDLYEWDDSMAKTYAPAAGGH